MCPLKPKTDWINFTEEVKWSQKNSSHFLPLYCSSGSLLQQLCICFLFLSFSPFYLCLICWPMTLNWLCYSLYCSCTCPTSHCYFTRINLLAACSISMLTGARSELKRRNQNKVLVLLCKLVSNDIDLPYIAIGKVEMKQSTFVCL